MKPGSTHTCAPALPELPLGSIQCCSLVGCIAQPSLDLTEAAKEIQAAESWLRDQGCTHARGPLNGSTFFSYRANLGPFERPLFLGEPQASPQPFLDAGYRSVAHYTSSLAENHRQIERGQDEAEKLKSQGWTLLSMNDVGGFQSTLKHFHRITAASFQHAFSYSAISWRLFQQLYAPMEARIDHRLIRLAQAPDGEIAGYCFSIRTS